MNVLIVTAHPEPTSFCVSLARCATDTLNACGHTVTVSDLYAQEFNATGGPADFLERADRSRFAYMSEQAAAAQAGTFEVTLAHEIAKLQNADLLILNFPLWWFSFPAVLKGWVDRVFAVGIAYAPLHSHASGLLRGKRAMLAFTTGAPAQVFTADGSNGDMNTLLFPIHYGVLHFAGMEVLPPFIAYGAARCDNETRLHYLASYEDQRLIARLNRLLSHHDVIAVFVRTSIGAPRNANSQENYYTCTLTRYLQLNSFNSPEYFRLPLQNCVARCIGTSCNWFRPSSDSNPDSSATQRNEKNWQPIHQQVESLGARCQQNPLAVFLHEIVGDFAITATACQLLTHQRFHLRREFGRGILN